MGRVSRDNRSSVNQWLIPNSKIRICNDNRAKQLAEIFRRKVLQRGARGIIGLQRIFKIMDDDGSKTLSKQEFEKACREFKAEIAPEDVGILF